MDKFNSIQTDHNEILNRTQLIHDRALTRWNVVDDEARSLLTERRELEKIIESMKKVMLTIKENVK